MRRTQSIAAGACAALALTTGVLAPTGALARTGRGMTAAPPSYYLALGDSLAAGAQPNAAGRTVPTTQGYANVLYATERRRMPSLRFKDIGCLGETTTTMIHGGTHCRYKGAQLADAVAFIKRHRIAFVTLDIGANDVDSCAQGTTIDPACISAGTKSIAANTPTIAAVLRKAVGRSVPVVGMTYYDPFLADWLQGSSGQQIAGLSVSLAKSVNQTLTSAYTAQTFKIADVATALDTYTPFSVTTPFAGGEYRTVPLAVAEVCDMTWMCAPAPKGPNIHANPLGYTTIAKVFAKAL